MNKPTKCQIWNCEHDAHHKHHIQSKAFKGNNKQYNIAWLCGNHHHETHIGSLVIEGWFMTDHGYVLLHHLKDEESITGLESDNVYIFGRKTI